MDVRCEKCHTEYELEESKVTEAGVTVKCTSCGNLFKIKRKTAQPPPRPPEPPPTDMGGMWLIRSPGGENRRFRELTTLQQWIVERKVTRNAEISRTGDTWKKLGDIAELAAFFAIVDQAQAAARPAPATERRSTQPFAPAAVGPARSPSMPAIPVGGMPTTEPFELEPDPPSAPSLQSLQSLEEAPEAFLPPPAAAPAPSAFAATQPAILAEPPSADRPRVAPTAYVKRPPVTRESWAGAAAMPPADSDEEDEPAWTMKPMGAGKSFGDEPAMSKNARTVKVDPSPFADEFNELDMIRRRRGGRGWMWAAAVILLGGGAAGFFLLRPTPADSGVIAAGADAGVGATTPVVKAGTPDGGAGAASVEAQKRLQDALAKLGEDTDEGFAAAAKILDETHVADDTVDAKLRAAQALVETTAAQAFADDAASLQKADSAQLRAEAERRLVRAAKLARDAAAKAPTDPDVAVALADVLRLEKKPTADVEKALTPAGDKPEALYVRGLLRARDGKGAEAVDLLEKAVAGKAKEGAELLRARYHLAFLAAEAKKVDEAKKEVDAILAAQPAHARAKALKARLEAPPVAVAKPVEPEPPPAPPPAPAPAPKPGKTPAPQPADEVGSGPITAGAYDGLVAKGNKQAENGDCIAAMKSFERALDARPGGVEALTGLGYCYLDRKQYSQALSNFRAALGISGRYSEALIGMAEAYRYQGLAKEAVAYYRRYLDQAPNGPKAGIARRHVEELGASDEAPRPDPPVTAPPPAPKVSAPPLDALPDKPGASSGPPPAAPPLDKLPDKAGQDKPAEKPAEPPPPSAASPDRSGEPTAPDSPH